MVNSAGHQFWWLLADRSRPAQALEVDVQGEIASAISMAHDSNWSLPYLEEQIKQHKGDVNAIFREVNPAIKNASCEDSENERLFLNQKQCYVMLF